MLKFKLEQIRSIVVEINRLEALREQVYKSQDYDKKNRYEKNLKMCKEEKRKLTAGENLIDKLYLSDEEKIIAKKYYYEGMTWKDAFYQTRTGKIVEDIIKKETSKYSDPALREKKVEQKLIERPRKMILRSIEEFYSYHKRLS